MFLSKYGVARHIYIPIIKRAVVDFAVTGDWPTPAAGDVKISKDGGAAANVTNLPTPITMGNTGIWDYSVTATEMQAAQVIVTTADAATKLVEDQSFIIETYGHASAQHVLDLGTVIENQVWDAAASSHIAVGTFGALNRIITSGQAQAGGASTITLKASDSATDSIYNGRIIAIVSGPGRNQYRIISTYLSKVVTVETPWKTQPTSASRYVIL